MIVSLLHMQLIVPDDSNANTRSDVIWDLISSDLDHSDVYFLYRVLVNYNCIDEITVSYKY